MTKLTVTHVSDHTFDVNVPLTTEHGTQNFTRGHHTVHVIVHEVQDAHAPHGHTAYDLSFSSPGLIAADLIFANYRQEDPQPVTPFSINGPNQSLRVYGRPHTGDHAIVRLRLDDATDADGHHKKHHHH